MMKKPYSLWPFLLVLWGLVVSGAWAEERDTAMSPEEVERHARIGYAALGVDDIVVALEHLEKAAAGGDVRSQVRLGMLFDTTEDNDLAVYWFGLAAEAGDSEGLLKLAEMHAKGEGVQKDGGKALSLFQQAAEQGEPRAQHQLGVVFEMGELGVQPSIKQAYEWYQKAADQDHFFSVERLYRAHRDGELGLVPSPEQTAVWERRREESRNNFAQERKRTQAELLELIRSVGLWRLPEPAEGAAASQGGAQ